MRLIDADALIDKAVQKVKDDFGYDFGICDIRVDGCDIAEAPTVEAELIRHGRWELREGFNHLVKCNVCGHEYIDYLECDNYCGNCGAKMDEEAEE